MQYINSVFMALHAINSTAIKFWHNTAFLKANKRMDIKRTSRNKSFIIMFSLRWLHPETQPHKSRAEPKLGSEMRYFITVPGAGCAPDHILSAPAPLPPPPARLKACCCCSCSDSFPQNSFP